MCIQKKFAVYRNVGVQRKAFLIDGNGCIVFANIKNETKGKRKRKKDLEGRHVMVIGSINRLQRANISFGNKRLTLRVYFPE